MMTNIETLKDYELMLEDNHYKVIMFISDWCPDCHYADRFWGHFETIYEGVNFYRVDREVLPNIAKDLNIFGVPSYIIYKGDRIIARYVDKYRKTFEQVKRFIDNNV